MMHCEPFQLFLQRFQNSNYFTAMILRIYVTIKFCNLSFRINNECMSFGYLDWTQRPEGIIASGHFCIAIRE